MTEQRTKLARWLGWRKVGYTAGAGSLTLTGQELPDPRNSADDCEALIRKLEDHGIEVTLSFDHGHESVSSVDTEEWPAPVYIGDDWKHGVCDLAEKVIDAAENGRAINWWATDEKGQ